MQDKELLNALLECEFEDDAIATLTKLGLFEEKNAKRWVALGKMPNNQSVVHAQQSTPAAALVEKFTNGLDAILLRKCKAAKINPRSIAAPPNMRKAVEKWYGDLGARLAEMPLQEIERPRSEICPGVNAVTIHFCCRRGSDTVEFANRHVLNEFCAHIRRDDKQAVRLAVVRGELG